MKKFTQRPTCLSSLKPEQTCALQEHRLAYMSERADRGGHGPDYMQRRYLDRRVRAGADAAQERLHTVTGTTRAGINSLIDLEAREQADESNTHTDSLLRNAYSRARLLVTDPAAYDRQAKGDIERIPVHFESAAQTILGTAEQFRFDITFHGNAYWTGVRTEAEVTAALTGKSAADLNTDHGLVVTALGPNAFAPMTAEQARAVARMLMIRYAAPILKSGHVSEVNARSAQEILFRNPQYRDLLQEHDQKEHKEQESRRNSLTAMINQLGEIKGNSHAESYDVVEAEVANMRTALLLPDASGTMITSTFIRDRISPQTDWAAWRAANPTLSTGQIRGDAAKHLRDLEGILNYYRSLGDLLQRIDTHITQVTGITRPTDPQYATLFTGIGVVNRANINNTTKPDAIADYLRRADQLAGLRAPQPHHAEAPIGARAVIEIYKKELKEDPEFEMSDDQAENAAVQRFFENEMSMEENQHLEEEIFQATGGRLTLFGGVANAMKAEVQGLFMGSDEDWMCRLAESQDVQIPGGRGRASNSVVPSAAEGVVLTGAAAATAIAITGAGVAGALAAPATLAAVATAQCVRRAVNSPTTAGSVGWGLLAGLSGIGTGLGAAGLYALGTVAAAPVAIAAAATGTVWGALKLTGADRYVFGTRNLGIPGLGRRFGARPAWGEIAHDRRKLEIVFDAMLKGVKDGKLNNTWYVQSQITEIGRMLLQHKWLDMGEAVAQKKLTAEQWKNFSMKNKRAEMQQQISEMVSRGAAHVGGQENAEVSKAAKRSEAAASERGSWRRAVWHYTFGGGLAKWMDEKK